MNTWAYYEPWAMYIRRVGPPRVVPCDIDCCKGNYPWFCASHDYGYRDRAHMLDGWLDERCPVSRLEEWRARRWAAAS